MFSWPRNADSKRIQIGQTNDGGVRTLSGTNPNNQTANLNLLKQWVVPKGGEYFFSPSIPALKETFALTEPSSELKYWRTARIESWIFIPPKSSKYILIWSHWWPPFRILEPFLIALSYRYLSYHIQHIRIYFVPAIHLATRKGGGANERKILSTQCHMISYSLSFHHTFHVKSRELRWNRAV